MLRVIHLLMVIVSSMVLTLAGCGGGGSGGDSNYNSNSGDSDYYSKSVTLSWEASPSTGVTGYMVYYGWSDGSLEGFEAEQGDSPVDVGDVLTATLTGLDKDEIYSFAVTAYNDTTESAYSNIVTEGTSADPDNDN